MERKQINKKRWTKEEEELLLDLIHKGFSNRSIATTMKRSRYSVENRIVVINRKKREMETKKNPAH